MTDAYIYYSDTANKITIENSTVSQQYAARWAITQLTGHDNSHYQNVGKNDRVWTVIGGPLSSANWTTLDGWLRDTNALTFKSDWTSDTVSVIPISFKTDYGNQSAAGSKIYVQIVVRENA